MRSALEGCKCSLFSDNGVNAKQQQNEMSEIELWPKPGVFHSHSSLALILMSDNTLICLAEQNRIITAKC